MHLRKLLAKRPPGVAAILTLLIAATLAGCGGQSGPTIPVAAGQPAPAASAGGSDAPAATGAGTDPLVVWPAYASCLRAHGVMEQDPALSADGDPSWSDPAAYKRMSQAVHDACDGILADLPGRKTGEDGVPDQATLLRFSQCMRQHGIPDFPDPDPVTGQVVLPSGISKTDPTLQAANAACQSVFQNASATPESGYPTDNATGGPTVAPTGK